MSHGREVAELLELVRLAVKANDLAQAEIHMLKVKALIYPNGRE